MSNGPDAGPGASASSPEPRDASSAAATNAPREGHGFTLFLACAALVAVFLLGLVRTRPIPMAPAAGPLTEEFHGLAAMTHIFDALRIAEGPARPHPVGSDANHAVRDWIVGQLRSSEVAATVERQWIVVPSLRRCAWVENIVARIPGSAGGGPAVLVVAHYDSVPAGPGAGDDMSGVAVLLEAARALGAGRPPARDVMLLFTDGEEAGLLGARAFVRAHGVDEIAAVVNADARGTRGPSLMFETGPGEARTVPAWAAGASRPLTSSLFAAVYRVMPNDTDFSVFRNEGVPGLNFAFVGAVQHYHTPLDTPGAVDVRSLQHQGDNVLAALRGLAADGALSDEDALSDYVRPEGELVWFDVLGFGVVRWSESAGRAFAFLAAALHLAVALVHAFRRRMHPLGVVAGVVLAVLSIAGALGAAHGVGSMLAAAGALPVASIASPSGALTVAAGVAVLVAGAVGVMAGRFLAPLSLSCGAGLVWSAGGVALAIALPGASYLLVAPALVAGLVALVRLRAPGPAADVAGLVTAAVLLLPLVPPIADAMGVAPFRFGPEPPAAADLFLHLLWIAAPFALVVPLLVPIVAAGGPRRWWVAAAGALLVFVGAAAAASSAPWTNEFPRAVNLLWVRDASARHAHWFVTSHTGLPAPFRAAGEFGDETERMLPWEKDRGWAAEAPTLDLPGPSLDGLSVSTADGSRRVRFRLVSRRGAPVTSLVISPTAKFRRAVIGGTPVPPETLRDRTAADGEKGIGPGSYSITCLTTPPEGVEIDLDFADEKPVDAYLADWSWGLPPGADEILRVRPADAVPQGAGDRTVVYRKVSL